MCDYCDCRSRALLAQLADDHGRITVATRRTLEAHRTGDQGAARQHLGELATVLHPHSALEEGGLYPELVAEGVPIDGLYEDHELIDSTVTAALGGDPRAWAALPDALTRLDEHIVREEYDLFTAAHQLLSDAAWDRIEQHRHRELHARGVAHRH